MKFADISAGDHVFVDANVLIYHFSPHPTLGPACHQLMAAIENQVISGYTSTHMVGELAHAMMIVEAIALPGWNLANVPKRLRRQAATVQQLSRFQKAVESIFQVVAIPSDLMLTSAQLSRQLGLLTNDALVVALMNHQGLTTLASHDPDFDRVPGITRFAPA